MDERGGQHSLLQTACRGPHHAQAVSALQIFSARVSALTRNRQSRARQRNLRIQTARWPRRARGRSPPGTTIDYCGTRKAPTQPHQGTHTSHPTHKRKRASMIFFDQWHDSTPEEWAALVARLFAAFPDRDRINTGVEMYRRQMLQEGVQGVPRGWLHRDGLITSTAPQGLWRLFQQPARIARNWVAPIHRPHPRRH